MAIQLEPLPYATHALEPYIGVKTVETHYYKHHAGYVDKLNQAIVGTDWEQCALIDMVRGAEANAVFRNAAQALNHSFYWKSMCQPGANGSEPGKLLGPRLRQAFGSVDRFRDAFAEAANGQFGSGWAWLEISQSGELSVSSTGNADTPVRHGRTPLLTIDVWEHAYYIDYQSERARYVDACVRELINWRFAERNLKAWLDVRSR
jgi:Fe-Mn family superoxide dismutase